jgi:hypothetical protein
LISAINREPWNGGYLIFAFPNKSDNALCKGSAYVLSAREQFFSSEMVDLTVIRIFFLTLLSDAAKEQSAT